MLIVFHNPSDQQLHSHSSWDVRLHSNVGFRNYLEHVRNRISDWTREQEILEEENNRVPTPVVPTPEPPQVQSTVGYTSLLLKALLPLSLYGGYTA